MDTASLRGRDGPTPARESRPAACIPAGMPHCRRPRKTGSGRGTNNHHQRMFVHHPAQSVGLVLPADEQASPGVLRPKWFQATVWAGRNRQLSQYFRPGIDQLGHRDRIHVARAVFSAGHGQHAHHGTPDAVGGDDDRGTAVTRLGTKGRHIRRIPRIQLEHPAAHRNAQPAGGPCSVLARWAGWVTEHVRISLPEAHRLDQLRRLAPAGRPSPTMPRPTTSPPVAPFPAAEIRPRPGSSATEPPQCSPESESQPALVRPALAPLECAAPDPAPRSPHARTSGSPGPRPPTPPRPLPTNRPATPGRRTWRLAPATPTSPTYLTSRTGKSSDTSLRSTSGTTTSSVSSATGTLNRYDTYVLSPEST